MCCLLHTTPVDKMRAAPSYGGLTSRCLCGFGVKQLEDCLSISRMFYTAFMSAHMGFWWNYPGRGLGP